MVKNSKITLSIVLPTRNEELSIEKSILDIKNVIKKHLFSTEIIVSDSSTDNTVNIVKKYDDVIIVKHNKEGYGNAYIEGFNVAQGKYIFCADPDGTYDFSEIPKFINELEKGYDLVIGNRFRGGIEPKSMPLMHKYIGNPLLSFLYRYLFKLNIGDVHCGMRAIKADALNKMNLKTTGMEFATEMLVKATMTNLSISEIPIKYYPRIGQSKLRTFSDGWRHLRFMLLYSPFYIFFLPGIILFMLGAFLTLLFYFKNPTILGFRFFVHPMFVSSLLVIIGYQIIFFSFFAKIYSRVHLNENLPKLDNLFKYINLERALVVGFLLLIPGFIIFLKILFEWINSDYGELNQIKNSIVALMLIILGVQTIFSGFMLSILSIKEK